MLGANSSCMVFEGLPPSPIWQRAGSFHHFCFEHYIKSIISCLVFEAKFGRGQAVFDNLAVSKSYKGR